MLDFLTAGGNLPFVVALLTMLRLLPMGLFGAFIGAAAERMDRRLALLLIVLSQMATSAAVAALAFAGAVQVWHLAVASFMNGIAWNLVNLLIVVGLLYRQRQMKQRFLTANHAA